jgi:hypothetical protein
MHGERQINNYDIFWTRHTPNTFILKKFIGSSDISNFLKFGIEGGQQKIRHFRSQRHLQKLYFRARDIRYCGPTDI